MGNLSEIRNGRFTSSEVYKLIKKGRGSAEFSAPALTYIEEKAIERRLKSGLDSSSYSRPMAWGNFMEAVALERLNLEELGYVLKSDETQTHPDIELGENWCGTSDYEFYDASGEMQFISELKCYQKKKFAQYTDVILKQDVELLKEKFPQEYWQAVSNGIINEVDEVEVVSFMPMDKDFAYIQDKASNYEGADAWKYRYIYEEEMRNLPFLNSEGDYKSLNRFRFKIPKEDSAYLESRIELASSLLATI